ncbi:glucose-1-phosphate adenylyltransferase [Thiorhodococcus mannitoliphagus]|uniref:Glucose-1-phosphate adenylyltransferase n=1 Tax=Thiorhodococcus mannitoliphagus TaxID=329406 RepID=A0A6P1DVJ3_9GAMM|nr:sugar phosphate nucleotidyltransferase [Thiorhodococcus mannitoliphagus]NEX20092.1 glucose-1-phosphate adenylyltransferase [Thiorhodococcus mannitoliphagus]
MSADTLILILAIDRGVGPDVLTQHRTKAAVPFGGKYRSIDFTLANCLHSGLRQVLVLTQYKSHSLQKHLRDGWSIFNPELGEFITSLPPQMRESQEWYAGPFDALRQNRYLIERNRAKQILVLDGGAVYRMDYAELVRAHKEAQAKVTVAIRPTSAPYSGTQAGVELDEDGYIRALSPAVPVAEDEDGERLQTMGVYLFDKAFLLAEFDRLDRGERQDSDLALDVVAPLTQEQRILAYRFGQARGRVTPDRYWCDLATIDAYYRANMELLYAEPPIDLYQADWNIHTYQGQYPPARTVPGPMSGNEGVFVNSMLAAGTVISGGGVNHSILFPCVRVKDGAIVEESILFDGVEVGEGAHLRNCIVEKDVVIPPNEQIGHDLKLDRERFTVSEQGIVVVSRGIWG